MDALAPPAIRPARLRPVWIAGGVGALVVAGVVGLSFGAVSLSAPRVFLEVLDHVPGVHVHSGLTERQAAIVWELRAPRVVLGFLVGAMLAVSGASYQGVFRNPLADPYLLGAAAGAGLGATLAIGGHLSNGIGPLGAVPLAAFVGALAAVLLAYLVSTVGGRDPSPAVLLLAGVAVMTFLTALQTFLLQRNSDTIREVYTFILGSLTTAGWHEVLVVVPYTAVAVSGLIGFVGLVVPHVVRMLFGTSYRVVVPLSILFGAAFLVLADVVARTAMSPAETPIGVVTAVFGAPFFVLVLRTRRRYV